MSILTIFDDRRLYNGIWLSVMTLSIVFVVVQLQAAIRWLRWRLKRYFRKRISDKARMKHLVKCHLKQLNLVKYLFFVTGCIVAIVVAISLLQDFGKSSNPSLSARNEDYDFLKCKLQPAAAILCHYTVPVVLPLLFC
jgi:hypothetical protein